jgi:hypothetical protein
MREEREIGTEFGEVYARYASITPAFIPRVRGETARRRSEARRRMFGPWRLGAGATRAET